MMVSIDHTGQSGFSTEIVDNVKLAGRFA